MESRRGESAGSTEPQGSRGVEGRRVGCSWEELEALGLLREQREPGRTKGRPPLLAGNAYG